MLLGVVASQLAPSPRSSPRAGRSPMSRSVVWLPDPRLHRERRLHPQRRGRGNLRPCWSAAAHRAGSGSSSTAGGGGGVRVSFETGITLTPGSFALWSAPAARPSHRGRQQPWLPRRRHRVGFTGRRSAAVAAPRAPTPTAAAAARAGAAAGAPAQPRAVPPPRARAMTVAPASRRRPRPTAVAVAAVRRARRRRRGSRQGRRRWPRRVHQLRRNPDRYAPGGGGAAPTSGGTAGTGGAAAAAPPDSARDGTGIGAGGGGSRHLVSGNGTAGIVMIRYRSKEAGPLPSLPSTAPAADAPQRRQAARRHREPRRRRRGGAELAARRSRASLPSSGR